MPAESIFGHEDFSKDYNPPIAQSDVMQLESDLSVRPTLDDSNNPSAATVFSSEKVVSLLTTKLSEVDVPAHAVSVTATTDQTMKSHILTEKITFNADQQLVTKKYVDDNAGTSMVDRPTTAVADQVSLRASDNSSSVYSLKTIKAGQGLQITTPEDSDCLQLGVGIDSNKNVLFTDGTITTGNQKQSVMIGVEAGHSQDGYGMGQNTFVGGYAGQNGHGAGNCYIGRGVGMNIQGSGNTYIAYPKTNVTESNMLRIGGPFYELICGTQLASGNYLRLNTNHVEFDVSNAPANYDSTHPDKLWVDGNLVRAGSTMKTEADYASLVSGQIYVDTQNGHVLKMKP